MSAELSPGIKSLHLTLDTPVDLITGKVRNDLSAVRVWYSQVPGFNPNESEGSLAFNGLSLDITISNLLPNTQYYVRYAFISAIDPNVFTLSDEESEITYEESVSVYGFLTNPSSVIPTNSAGTNGNYSVAGGTFEVREYSQNVTGNGVVYAIVADTTVGGLSATINPTSGVYTVSGLTANYGSVIFSATYKDITIFTTLVVTKARAGIDGTTAQLLKLNAEGNAFVFKDTTASLSDTQQLTFTATLQNLVADVEFTVTAYDVNRQTLGPVAYSVAGTNTITITGAQFNPLAYNNAVAYIEVVASYNLLSDIVSVYRINNGTEQIIVEFSNESHTIPANFDGTTEPAGYIGSGNIIRVKEGNNYLPVDFSSPYANGSWTVTNTNAVNITADPTPGVFTSSIEYDTHSNMTANTAYIDYTIEGKTSTGSPFNITRRQSFAKSVGGVPGFSASLVTLTTTELVFIKFKDGSYSSNSVTIFTTTQNINNPVYTWTVDGVVQVGATLQQFEFVRPETVGAYTIGVTVTSSSDSTVSAQDTMSIAYIEEGSDAYTFLFKDPQIVLSANNLGIVENGITQVTNHIIGAQGIRLLTPGTDIVYTIDSTENCTANITTVTGTWNQQFTITGAIYSNASISNAKVIIKCQVPGGPSFLQTCYIAKVKTGATGAAGAAGVNAVVVDLVSEADVVTAAADGTGYSLPTGNSLKLYSGNTLITTGITYGGTATKNGLTATVNASTGAITLSGASWTSNSETFNITATYGGVSYTAAYTIAKSRAGSDAVFVDLLSEAEIVNTTSTGTGYTLPTGNSMRVFKGGAQVTGGVTYSGTATKNGLTLTIDSTTGALTLSGASWTSDKETFILTATFGGVAYTYTYKITKAKQGTAGTNGATGPQGPAGANGTNGAAAPKTTSGYIYYTLSTGSNPGTPSASGFNFTTGAFTGLTANWSTTITMTGNGTYWATRYVVTESSAGSNTGVPTFSSPFTHQNFSGLVTFTDQSNTLSGYATQTYASNTATTAASNAVSNRPTYFEIETQGYTTIHGGNISTGTLTVDKIANGNYGKPALYGGTNTFGFGTGTIAAGTIATVGYFATTDSGTLGLGVLSSQNVAFVASTVWSGYAGGFGNRWGVGINDIAEGNNRTLAQFCSNTIAGRFFHRDTNHTVQLATINHALNVSGPVNINGFLIVNGVELNTNGGTGYGPGSSPVFDNINGTQIVVTGRIFGQSTNIGGSSGYTGVINVGDVACGGDLKALGSVRINGQVYAGSSKRYKENILPVDVGLDFVLSLNPVKFDRKSDKLPAVGFIAEDFPDTRFIGYTPVDPEDPFMGMQVESLNYTSIVVPLVKAVQELNEKIVQLTLELNALKRT